MTAETAKDDLTQLVGAAVQVATEAAGGLDNYLRWNYVRFANKLYPLDYTTEELMAMNAVMAQAWSRKLSLMGTGDPLLDPLVGVIDTQVRRRPGLRLVADN